MDELILGPRSEGQELQEKGSVETDQCVAKEVSALCLFQGGQLTWVDGFQHSLPDYVLQRPIKLVFVLLNTEDGQNFHLHCWPEAEKKCLLSEIQIRTFQLFL